MIDYAVYFVAFSAVRADSTNGATRDNADQHENLVRSYRASTWNYLRHQ